jgi:hypothetical protein
MVKDDSRRIYFLNTKDQGETLSRSFGPSSSRFTFTNPFSRCQTGSRKEDFYNLHQRQDN